TSTSYSAIDSHSFLFNLTSSSEISPLSLHDALPICGVGRAEPDLDEVSRLVDLDRVPGKEAREVSHRDPPEAGRAHGAAEGPVHRDPGRVHNITRRPIDGDGALRRMIAVGLEPEILGPAPQQEVEWRQ